MNKIIKKLFLFFAALSLFAFAALPAGAQVSQTASCTLVKDVEVSIVVAGANNDVVRIHSSSLVSDTVDPTPDGSPAPNSIEMNGGNPDNDTITHANIRARIKNDNATEFDAGKGSNPAKAIPATSLSAIANKWGIICLMNTINTVINWISIVVLILSTALIIYAGFLWMTGGDNPEFKQKSSKVILAALIGFGIVILGNLLPALISGILLP